MYQMSLLDKLEKRIGRYAVPNLTIYLIAGQTILYVLFMTGRLNRSISWLAADLLLRGEWWRLAIFPFDPPVTNPIFAFFAWYIFYLMGSALEGEWGDFRYNIFLLTGYLLTVASSFLVPSYRLTNTYLGGSVFLAFAALYPDFELLLFFVLPVRIKWLAVLTWLYYAYLVVFGGWPTRVLVIASVGNFLLFFAREIVVQIRYGRRRLTRKAERLSLRADEPFHRCTVCGITDKSHPQMDFRYCQDCAGQHGYCREHILNHEHVS
jgi:hypothetical protein